MDVQEDRSEDFDRKAIDKKGAIPGHFALCLVLDPTAAAYGGRRRYAAFVVLVTDDEVR